MSETPFNTVTSCLWDLRAHCEQQLRHLTEAQKCADRYRASAGSRYHAKNRIVADLQNIVRLTVTIRAFANECSGMVGELPHD